ncbi:hypothetical protein AUQ43_18530 [Thalassospira sp. MCCC 1A01148]|nr:hypothetical protein AUQ43_18530 [Thalassospira sp. MCCC 1A01148]
MYTALGLISFCLALVSLVLAVVWLVLSLIRKDQRTKYSKRTGLAFLAMFVLLVAGGYFADADMNESAIEAGFAGKDEMNAAKNAGFTDPLAYRDHLADQKAKAEAGAQAAADAAAKALAEAEVAAREKAEAEAVACRQSVSCYGDKYIASASVYCPDQIERLAKWDHEWTDGMLEMKFSHYRWKDKEAGIVDFIGDKLKMQNGFGAWQNVIYVCTFSTDPEMVLEVSAEPGRL